jgi:hypothetical protein
MATAKKAAKKPDNHKHAPPNQSLPEGMLGTKDVAERLHITPRELRVMMRSLGMGTGGERYAWKKNDPSPVQAG